MAPALIRRGFIRILGLAANAGVAVTLLFTYTQASPPPLISSVTFNAPSGGGSTGVAVDFAGNIFMAGDLGPKATLAKNILLAKFDQGLVFQSSIVLNGALNTADYVYDVSVDVSGDLLAAGEMNGNAGAGDVWIAKYSPGLVLKSSRTLSGDFGGQDFGAGITSDRQGNIFVTGAVGEISGLFNLWVAKYDPSLTLISSYTLTCSTSGTEMGASITMGRGGDVWVAGSVRNNEYNVPVIWIGKFDSSLTLKSSITVLGSNPTPNLKYSRATDIALDPYGNVVAIGFDSYGFWVGKYTSSLALISSGTLSVPNASNPWDIVADWSGKIWVNGQIFSSSSKGWIGKMSTTFQVESSEIISGAVDGGYGGGIVLDKTGNITASGVNFDIADVPKMWVRKYLGSPDSVNPESAVLSPAPGTITGSAPSISGTAYDFTALSGVDVKVRRNSDMKYWDGSTWGSAETWNQAVGTEDWTYAGLTSSQLTPGTSYWAISRGRDSSGNIELAEIGGSTFTYLEPPPDPGAGSLHGTALGVSSINWTWSEVPYAEGYRLIDPYGGELSGYLPPGAADWEETGLLPNTPYIRRYSAYNSVGASTSAPAIRYTLAAPPAGPAVIVHITSAAITWELNGNPAGTTAQIYVSTDEVSYSLSGSTWGVAFTAGDLLSCASSYIRLRNINGDGLPTAYVGPLTVFTRDFAALPPSGLTAEALPGGRIALNWRLSPSLNISEYRLYSDGGSGIIDYITSAAELQPQATHYITGILTSSAAYTFALRAVNLCGVEEENVHVLAAAPSLTLPSALAAAIKEPFSGKKVSGNRLTIFAEIISGAPHQADKVLFQYRPPGGSWTDIIPASVNHTNPDLNAPYFIHWDVSALASGNYGLRAIAYDVYGASDPAPSAISVRVDNADFEVRETLQGDGKTKKEQLINNTVPCLVTAADPERSWITKVAVPPAAVNAASATLAIVSNPEGAPPQETSLNPIGHTAEVTLSNGQHQLNNGQMADVTISYPDEDGDGIVDGTFFRVETLRIYSYDTLAMAWKPDLLCRVDKEKRQVIGSTHHFSYFAVFAPLAASISGVRGYPNPWKPGSGGRFDAASVTFDGLPSTAMIQIFNIAGDLVRELRVSVADSGTKTWDGRNSSGSKAASGVYLVLVRSAGKTKLLKLGVER